VGDRSGWKKLRRAIALDARWAIALRAIIAVFGICCEGRSIFLTQASLSVQLSQCLVFAAKGDRYPIQ
jgi:hypothetical protein